MPAPTPKPTMSKSREVSLKTLISETKELLAKIQRCKGPVEGYEISVGLKLLELQKLKPKGIRWGAFTKKHFGFGERRARELIAIAKGNTTVAEHKRRVNERQKKHREAKAALRHAGFDPDPGACARHAKEVNREPEKGQIHASRRAIMYRLTEAIKTAREIEWHLVANPKLREDGEIIAAMRQAAKAWAALLGSKKMEIVNGQTQKENLTSWGATGRNKNTV